MKAELWFPTPIWYGELNFNIDAVKDKCLELRKLDPNGRAASNAGGWQSNDVSLSDYAEFADLLLEMKSKIKEVSEQIHPNFVCDFDNVWININGPQDYNRLHWHPRATLSGVVYIDVDKDSGKINFYPESLQKHYPIEPFNSKLFYESASYIPSNQMMLIFPAWLKHDVNPSPNSTKERISMSFNLHQKW
jgi:uncharacterized protein (TIGR02466 family)